MTLTDLLTRLRETPAEVEFEQVMAVIGEHYSYQPSAFSIGRDAERVENPAGSNEGSCRILAFAALNRLTPEQTLACFGRFYRDEVLGHPEGTDHANIRAFMRFGPEAVVFEGTPLAPRSMS